MTDTTATNTVRTGPALLRVREVAAELGMSRPRAYALIADGVIPHVRINERTIRVPRASLDAWLEVQNERAVQSITAPRSESETER